MVDLNTAVAALLSDLVDGNVSLQFPDTKSAFPCISLSVVSNQSQLILDRVERLSFVSYQIDVWTDPQADKTRQQCEELAVSVSAAMLVAGWKRDNARPMRDPSGLRRSMLQFSGYVDNVTGKIYPTNHL